MAKDGCWVLASLGWGSRLYLGCQWLRMPEEEKDHFPLHARGHQPEDLIALAKGESHHLSSFSMGERGLVRCYPGLRQSDATPTQKAEGVAFVPFCFCLDVSPMVCGCWPHKPVWVAYTSSRTRAPAHAFACGLCLFL